MWKTRIPPPLIAIVAAVLMYGLDARYPIARVVAGAPRQAGWLLIAAGIALDGVALALFVASKTSVNPLRIDGASALVVRGPYRFTRNPMYLGLLLSLCGWTVYLGSLSPIAVIVAFERIIVILQIRPEEEALERRFGESYRRYKTEVGRWFGWTRAPGKHPGSLDP